MTRRIKEEPKQYIRCEKVLKACKVINPTVETSLPWDWTFEEIEKRRVAASRLQGKNRQPHGQSFEKEEEEAVLEVFDQVSDESDDEGVNITNPPSHTSSQDMLDDVLKQASSRIKATTTKVLFVCAGCPKNV